MLLGEGSAETALLSGSHFRHLVSTSTEFTGDPVQGPDAPIGTLAPAESQGMLGPLGSGLTALPPSNLSQEDFSAKESGLTAHRRFMDVGHRAVYAAEWDRHDTGKWSEAAPKERASEYRLRL